MVGSEVCCWLMEVVVPGAVVWAEVDEGSDEDDETAC